MFVDPDGAGDAGVTDALLGAIARWAGEEKGFTELYLHVSELNERARRSYEKRGFVRDRATWTPSPNSPATARSRWSSGCP